MPLYHLLILALVQGITEFLPVSSSGHLVLTHHLLNGGLSSHDLCWEQDRMLDIAVHVGTLLSVLVYYRRDVMAMAAGLIAPKSDGFKMGFFVVLSSLPVIAAGFIVHALQPDFLCWVQIMAWTTLLFGIVLWVADKYFPAHKTVEQMTWKDSLLIGVFQCLALVPGVSRSGITMTAGRFLGFSRTESARFSLLLAIVAIAGAGTLTGKDLIETGDFRLGMDVLLGIGLSFVSGLIAIALMIKWLERSTFTPFAIYRVILGGLLLALIYSGAM